MQLCEQELFLKRLVQKLGEGRIFGDNNDTPFMNPSTHLPLSVSQLERSSSQKEARLKSYLKNVQ